MILAFVVHYSFLLAFIHGYRWIGFHVARERWMWYRILLTAVFAMALAYSTHMS